MVDVLTALLGRSSVEERSFGDALEYFNLDGNTSWGANPFFHQTLRGDKEEVGRGFEGYTAGVYRGNGIVFALEQVRMQVFSDAKPIYQRLIDGRPGELFLDTTLDMLRNPGGGMTGRQLMRRSIAEADLAGNNFTVRRSGSSRIRTVRPDWMTIVLGVPDGMDDLDADPVDDLNAEVVGYLYHPGGRRAQNEAVPLHVDEVAHWAPVPDPLALYRGMSWLTPVLREVQSDGAAVTHKQKFYENGATPNMVVTLDSALSPDVFKQWVEIFNQKHGGAANAYKTLFLGGGADVDVVGRDFGQIDYAATQGAGETRIASAAGIHPSVVGFSSGLEGSALNAGNYSATRRAVADKTFRPLWGDYFETVSKLVKPPQDARLWYDDRSIEFLQEDQKDNAQIQSTRAQSIRTLIDAGYTSESVVKAITNDDMTLLEHSGLFSVQLQEAGASVDSAATPTPTEESSNE